MKDGLTLTAIAILLATSAGAACPPFPGPHAAEAGGVLASTVMGPTKRINASRAHIAFPGGALDSVKIVLERSGCFGTCPSYSIEIDGNGTARFAGDRFTLVGGVHTTTLPRETVRCLLDDFRTVDFWSLAPKYQAPITDNPVYRLKLIVGGRSKTVTDYVGQMVGMPKGVTWLEDAIDVAAANRWKVGDASTIETLKAERFDFSSREAADMLANAAELDNEATALELLSAGAPPTGRGFGRDDGPEGPSGPPAIEAAAAKGYSRLVGALIAAGALSGADARATGAVLRAAAKSADPATVSEVLRQNPDVNARDLDGHTALMSVADGYFDQDSPDLPRRRAAVIAALLSAGANARLRDSSNHSALFGLDSTEAVGMLVKAGAALETRDNMGDTPLTGTYNDDAALALIQAGADTSAVNDDGNDVLENARHDHWPRTLAYLEGHGLSARSAPAPKVAWPPTIEALNARHFDFHSRQAALMLIRAANEKRGRLALDLVAAGAPPNQTSIGGRTGNSFSEIDRDAKAAAPGTVSVDQGYLLENMAIDAASVAGDTALVRALIAAGAFTDAPYHAKESALISAAEGAQPDVITLLLEAGADVDGRDDDGNTALIATTATTDPSDETRWHVANLETIRRLLAANANPRLANSKGETALHGVWNAGAVELLAKAGADVNARNDEGETPLLATLSDDAAMALVRLGADATAKDWLGKSVFEHAKKDDLPQLLAYLRARGIKK